LEAVPFTVGKAMGRGTHQEHSQVEEQVVQNTGTANEPGAKKDAAADLQNPDDQGPVLSLPFENYSTQPEKGDLPPVVQEGVTFESDDAAKFSTESQFVIPDGGKISGDSGTISFNLQPEWGGDDQTDASLVQLRTPNVWDNRLQIFKNGRFLRFLLTDNTGQETDSSAPVDNWQPGEQHLVTTTWGRDESGQGVTTFYIDGKQVAQRNFDGQLEVPQGTPLYIGSDLPGGGTGARGSLSHFQVYNRPLAPEEVANLSTKSTH